MSNHEPGTFADATVRGVPNVRVLRRQHEWSSVELVNGWVGHPDNRVTDIRPLVVLDLADAPRPDREHILRALRGTIFETVHWIADQIEAQTQPLKPAEPLGLGAVVTAWDEGAEEAVVRPFVRQHDSADYPWLDDDGCAYTWADLRNPVVEREGWSE